MPSSASSLPRIVEPQDQQQPPRCLSCGRMLDRLHQRYCAVACRQTLHQQLRLRTGLLKALETRYATFQFNRQHLFLNVLPVASKTIYSFLQLRTNGHTPAQDFARLSNTLGNLWWAEKNRTRKRYRATRYLLEQALHDQISVEEIQPFEKIRPRTAGQSLFYLKLDPEILGQAKIKQHLKTAYRQAALRHHPDKGGNATLFRKVHEAYRQLSAWAENPVYTRRRGFHNKWFYDGRNNQWLQPLPLSQTSPKER